MDMLIQRQRQFSWPGDSGLSTTLCPKKKVYIFFDLHIYIYSIELEIDLLWENKQLDALLWTEYMVLEKLKLLKYCHSLVALSERHVAAQYDIISFLF